MTWQEFLLVTIGNNTIRDYFITIAVFAIILSVLRIFKFVIIAKLKKWAAKTKTEFDDAVVESIETIGWPFYIILSLVVSVQYLQLASWMDRIIYYILLITFTYYLGKVLGKIIRYAAKKIHARKGEEPNPAIVGFFVVIVNIVLWAIFLVMVLDNLGYNVTTLVAGLGIGGIAIAFALQSVLADLFASISIYFDKPFEVGDEIQIDKDQGHVQKIGLKTTRIKTLQGEELIVSNKMLTENRVNNLKRMDRRRVLYSIGVTYDTPVAKIKKIPVMIKDIITKNNCVVDRVHFKKFSDHSLDFEIVYYVNAKEMKVYMDAQQSINIDIMERFQKEKIEFAYPTQVVHMRK